MNSFQTGGSNIYHHFLCTTWWLLIRSYVWSSDDICWQWVFSLSKLKPDSSWTRVELCFTLSLIRYLSLLVAGPYDIWWVFRSVFCSYFITANFKPNSQNESWCIIYVDKNWHQLIFIMDGFYYDPQPKTSLEAAHCNGSYDRWQYY